MFRTTAIMLGTMACCYSNYNTIQAKSKLVIKRYICKNLDNLEASFFGSKYDSFEVNNCIGRFVIFKKLKTDRLTMQHNKIHLTSFQNSSVSDMIIQNNNGVIMLPEHIKTLSISSQYDVNTSILAPQNHKIYKCFCEGDIIPGGLTTQTYFGTKTIDVVKKNIDKIVNHDMDLKPMAKVEFQEMNHKIVINITDMFDVDRMIRFHLGDKDLDHLKQSLSEAIKSEPIHFLAPGVFTMKFNCGYTTKEVEFYNYDNVKFDKNGELIIEVCSKRIIDTKEVQINFYITKE